MEEFVIAALAKIAECTVRPVGRWLCYSCHYKSNMEYLKNQETELRDAQKEVECKVKTASDNGDDIKDNVKRWLTKVDDIIDQLATKKLGGGEEEAGSRNSNPSCLNLKQRHQMSREAKQMVGNIAKLLENGKFDGGVSHRPAAQEIVTPRTMDYMTLDSRISITKRIMEALGDANINKIGVWGSPGVGKSTLMNEVFKKAKEEGLFNEVAQANVTDSPNISRIQGEIAEMLDLKLDCTTEKVRAARLQARLENDKKKILVILDDICERLDLEKIGITPSERCKVLLTSRDLRVLSSKMGINLENNFKLDTLGEEEAWNLFEKMVGDTVKDDRDLRNEAIKVAKACGGLPIALVTVSRSLKDEKSLGIWKDALVQLTRPTLDTEIWSPLYSCIQLSYKRLDGRQLKSLFLLCAQQGNYYISYRDLLRYGFGLCLFEGIATLEEARNRLESLVRDLQDACLLIKSPRSSVEFYMHDVVRHVATIIASKDEHNMFVMRGDGGQKAWPDVDSLKRCEALSIHGGDRIHKYLNKIECPELRYFHVQCNLNPIFKTASSTSFQGMDKLEDIFFQGMEKLEVLSLRNIELSSLFPLTNLQTLCLDGCKLGDIRWIGELKTLAILSLARTYISNLPGEIGSLTRLQLFDLTNCSSLTVIPPNVLSSLVNLEELYMRNIKVQWEVEGPNNEGKNASLAELKKLSHLITLEIKIPDANNLPKDLFFEKLERYHICIGDIRDSFYYKMADAFLRSLALKLNMSSFQLDFGIKMLLKRTENLYLDESNSTKSVFYELDREDFQQLKHLHIRNGNIKHIPELRTPAVAFPILETFVLEHMISLEEICQGNLPLTSFKNLKVLKVEKCEKLRFIFTSSIARGLSLLEELKIRKCNNVGAIFVKEEEDHGIEEVGDMMLFRRLQTLVLIDLPKLVSFLNTRETNSEGNDHDLQVPLLHHQGLQEQGGTLFGVEEVAFPSLEILHIEGLPKIKHIWSEYSKTVYRFQKLQEIYAWSCESLKSLFPTSIISCLEQLKLLWIGNCGLEEIVAGGGGEPVVRTLVFPRVSKLNLINLKRLKWFYKGVHVSKWPMLEKIWIEGCEKVKIFASGLVSFEETVEERPSEMSIKQPLFLVDELSFPNLLKLYIPSMDVLEIIGQDQVATSSFSNIQELEIADCEKLLHVFQSNLITTTTTLIQSLTINRCSSLETIFGKLEGKNDKEPRLSIAPRSGMEESTLKLGTRHMEFPTLTEMTLGGLPKLKWILEGVHILECPSLKKLQLWECEQVINMIWASKFPSSSSQETSQQNQLQTCIQHPIFVLEEGTFPNLELLSLRFGRTICPSRFSDFPDPPFLITRLPNLLELQGSSGWEEIFPYELVDPVPRLRQLELHSLPMLTHLWKEGTQPCPLFHNLEFLNLSRCGKLKNIVPSSVFLQNLTELDISYCHGLINLLTSSTAKTLVQLKKMTVTECKRIIEIVAMEGGEANVAITFKKLTYLELDGLPNLRNFCSGSYSFKFPSLDEVIVRHCPEMKTFCHGVLRTPKLKAVQATEDENDSHSGWHWKHDLNTTTHFLWESNHYDTTSLLFRERVENFKEDEDHP